MTPEKCLQRMKCPPSRKEKCSEECTAGKSIFLSEFVLYFPIGNTEEEMEEHEELTRDENRNSLTKSPKQKYEANINPKKSSTKTKHSSSNSKTDL